MSENQQSDDLRLIEDYLPIEAISAEASREKSFRKGHISTLHLWWARRPLVACRAAVYGALVPADRWVKDVDLKNPPDDPQKAAKAKNGKKKGLNRKAAKEFVTKLCRYPKTDPKNPADIKLKLETEAAIVEAQRHILEAHAERLTAELSQALKLKPPLPPEEGRGEGLPLPPADDRGDGLPLPPGEGRGEGLSWGDAAPGWLNEFNWPRDKSVVTYDDIVAGRAPRPRVLDMFAGGGAIPLEALRLGCEAYALDLNPVAHIIQLCTLVYPQKYGKPDPAARGMTGPPAPLSPGGRGAGGEGAVRPGETTWGGLANEVRYWGNWVLERVRKEIGDLYPPIPDPEVWATPPEIDFDRDTGQWNVTQPGKPKRGVKLDSLRPLPKSAASLLPKDDADDDAEDEETNGSAAISLPPGFLQPVAYLWTRTVRCKNPSCAATVPLVRQTWFCKKAKRYVALRMMLRNPEKRVAFKAVECEKESQLGFDPNGFSSGGNATCPFCGAVADVDFVKAEGMAGRVGQQLMGIACLPRAGSQGKIYLGDADIDEPVANVETAKAAIERLAKNVTTPDEPLPAYGTLGFRVQPYGHTKWESLFAPRQLAAMMSLVNSIIVLQDGASPDERRLPVLSQLACYVDRAADHWSMLCAWNPSGEKVQHTFGRQALPMVWDFAEASPFGTSVGDWWGFVLNGENAIDAGIRSGRRPARVMRGSATNLPVEDDSLDALITDPPYYDNVPYADLSDFFYVWLRRSIGKHYPEHFSAPLTPKKAEAVAEAMRHQRDQDAANRAYEAMLAEAFRAANRALKPDATALVVYAHKTTLGWATLVDALRRAGFVVSEAWPLDTENRTRLRGMDSAALASSIFLVARKRSQGSGVGNYEDDVQPDLQQIIRERVETLWEMGIAGADLVIACVGAGLRAFTKYEKVEYANGEEVPAEKFLAEVEGVVLDTMMGKLFGQSGATVSSIDPASRFYVLWRFVYKAAEIDAGEAIVFTYAQHVELDGQQGLSAGRDALVEKKKAKYRARDFTERGDNEKLGLPDDQGQPAPLIDVLHRVLWLMENSPRKLSGFLSEAAPDRERLRVLAQTLAGKALSGKSAEDADKLVGTTAAEKSSLGKLLANWRSLIDHAVVTKDERADQKAGQKRLDLK